MVSGSITNSASGSHFGQEYKAGIYKHGPVAEGIRISWQTYSWFWPHTVEVKSLGHETWIFVLWTKPANDPHEQAISENQWSKSDDYGILPVYIISVLIEYSSENHRVIPFSHLSKYRWKLVLSVPVLQRVFTMLPPHALWWMPTLQ